MIRQPICKVCTHPERVEINRQIAERIPQKTIAAQFGMHYSSISRHKGRCIPVQLSRATASADDRTVIVVEKSLEKTFGHINKLIDACDQWLLDPDGSGQYTLDPRAYEITVIYNDRNDTDERGKPLRKKDTLQNLIERLGSAQYMVESVETKSSDPRKLILDTAAEIRAHLDFYAKLHGLYQKERSNWIEEEERKRWVAEKIAEIQKNFGVDEQGAIAWMREEFPQIPELLM